MNNKLKKVIPFFIYALMLAFLVKEALGNGDFKVFLEAAKLVAAGKTPYHKWIFLSDGNYCLYFYSPLWAIILIPFTYLPHFVPNFIWLLANAYFIYRIWIILEKYIDIQLLSINQKKRILILTILLSIRFILYNFGLIQMTIFLLWGVMESLVLFKENKFIKGGMLLSLIINIKILPIAILPYLFYRKQFKGAFITILFSLVLLVLPGIFLGWSANLHLLSDWWTVINPNNAEHLLESDLGSHSLTALIPSLLTETKGDLPYHRNIINLDIETATNILNAVRLCLILFTIYFLKLPPLKVAKSKLHEIHELSYILLIIPLIFPHQQKYAFFLSCPAFFYISYYLVIGYSAGRRIANDKIYLLITTLILLSFVLMTLTTDGLIGRSLNRITQHFKFITYGDILLIIMLIICSPERIEKINKTTVIV